MSNLIEKYKISQKDLYVLSLIESKKQNSNFIEKEKLKSTSLVVLRPYNVKLIEIGNLFKEISKSKYHLIHENEFTEDEKKSFDEFISNNKNVVKFYKDFWNSSSKKNKLIYVLIIIAVFSLFVNLFNSNSIKPDQILGKKLRGTDIYQSIGNTYRAEITIEIFKDFIEDKVVYKYSIERIVYENGYFFKRFYFQGKMKSQLKKYSKTLDGPNKIHVERELWVTDNDEYGLILKNGNPINSDGQVELQLMGNSHVITLR